MGEQPVLWHFGGAFFQQRQAKVMISGTPSTRYSDGEAQRTDDQGTRLLTLKDFFFESNFWLCLRFNANLGQKKPKSSAFLGHAASYGWDDAEQLKEWRDKKWWSIGETDHSQIRWSTSYTQSKGQMHPQTSRAFPQDPLKWIPSRNQMWQWKIPHL